MNQTESNALRIFCELTQLMSIASQLLTPHTLHWSYVQAPSGNGHDRVFL